MPPRESKADQRFSLHWQHLYEEGSFAGPTMRPWIHIFTVLPGGSHWRRIGAGRRVSRQTLLSRFEVLGGVQTDGGKGIDRWMDGGMLRWWSEEECFSHFHMLLSAARSSTPPPQNRSGVDPSEWRERSQQLNIDNTDSIWCFMPIFQYKNTSRDPSGKCVL